MKIFARFFWLAAAVFSVAATAAAADSTAGKTLYDAKCLVCHGVGGASAIPANPILAGQHVEYLRVETKAFRDGTRYNPVMTPMGAGLTDADIDNIAQYLSEQTPVIAGATDERLARSGERLYRGGDIARGVPACAACHSPTGSGIAPTYPLLSGQYAEYIASTLRDYAAGTRANDVMTPIAQRLSEDEISALAAYISGLSY